MLLIIFMQNFFCSLNMSVCGHVYTGMSMRWLAKGKCNWQWCPIWICPILPWSTWGYMSVWTQTNNKQHIDTIIISVHNTCMNSDIRFSGSDEVKRKVCHPNTTNSTSKLHVYFIIYLRDTRKLASIFYKETERKRNTFWQVKRGNIWKLNSLSSVFSAFRVYQLRAIYWQEKMHQLLKRHKWRDLLMLQLCDDE